MQNQRLFLEENFKEKFVSVDKPMGLKEAKSFVEKSVYKRNLVYTRIQQRLPTMSPICFGFYQTRNQQTKK